GIYKTVFLIYNNSKKETFITNRCIHAALSRVMLLPGRKQHESFREDQEWLSFSGTRARKGRRRPDGRLENGERQAKGGLRCRSCTIQPKKERLRPKSSSKSRSGNCPPGWRDTAKRWPCWSAAF